MTNETLKKYNKLVKEYSQCRNYLKREIMKYRLNKLDKQCFKQGIWDYE